MSPSSRTHLALCTFGILVALVHQASAGAYLKPLMPYDRSDPLPALFVAGLDFNDVTGRIPTYETAQGYLGVPNSNAKSYNLLHNGVTFDITVTNANLTNQNRWRNETNFNNNGALLNDFEQWFGNTGTPVEVTFKLSGLVPGANYELGFFHVNIGAGQTTQSYYDGDSSASPFIGTNQSSGNFNNPATWEPGTIIGKRADVNGELTITAVAGDGGQRFTLAGLSVSIPEPSSAALLGLAGGLALLRRRR